MAKPKTQYAPPTEVEVKMFALDNSGAIRPDLSGTDAECRNNNPLTKNTYGCGTITVTYPYPTNSMTVNLENDYLPFVVAQELSDGTLEALKAQAIAARSFALHITEFSELTNSTSHQVFTPYSVTLSSLHHQAVQETYGMLMICNNDTDCEPERKQFPIFAEYSKGHTGDTTVAWAYNHVTKHRYLASIWDPIHTAGGGHGEGMSQEGAKLWATGLTDGNNYYPIWEYRRILAHYYSNIEFQGVPDTRNDYRFNAIQISNFSTGQNDYIFYDTNRRKDDITLILQNTGTLSWILGWEQDFTCKPASYNIALSYHIYDETTSQIACGNPNIPGGNPCFEGVRNYMCVPFSGGGTPPGGSFIIQGVTVDLPSQLPLDKCYILRWDIELARNHNETTWISRLQQNPWLAQWPTQDIRFCYVRQSGGGDPDPPQNPTAASGHTVNTWSNNPNMTIAWSPPGSPVSGYEYRYQGNGSDLGSGWQATTQTQTPPFNITQDGNNHSLKIRSVLGGNKSSSITAGPYLIDRRSPSLSISQPVPNWVTTNQITLNWTGTDTGISGQVSGLSHYDVYYAANPGDPWTPLALNTTNETVSLTGNDDQYYYFKIIAYDRAGNSTEKQKTIQVRTFPYLSVSAAPSLNWTVTLSNTAPSVRTLQVLNNGGKVMTWTAQTDFPYLTLPFTNGLDDTTMPITLTHPLTYGTFSDVLTVTGTTYTRDSPAVIPVTIQVIDQFRYYFPIIFKQ